MKYLHSYGLYQPDYAVKTNESTEEDPHRELMIKKYGVVALEECDSIIINVKDILLELNDLEIFTSINYTPLTFVGLEKTSPKLFLQIKCDSQLWNLHQELIDEVVETIKGLVKSYRYNQGSNAVKTEERVGLTDKYMNEYLMLIQK